MIKTLDSGLKNFSSVVYKTTGKDLSSFAGAGAAGGTTFGLISFLNCSVASGIEIVLSKTNFESELNGADFVITGEGKFDLQTLNGKAPSVIIKKSKSNNVPVFVICGFSELDENDVKKYGVSKIFEISDKNLPLEINLKNAEENLKSTAFKILDYYF